MVIQVRKKARELHAICHPGQATLTVEKASSLLLSCQVTPMPSSLFLFIHGPELRHLGVRSQLEKLATERSNRASGAAGAINGVLCEEGNNV